MLVSSLAAGLLAGLLARGDLHRLGRLRPRLLPLFILAIAARLIAILPWDPEGQRALYTASLWGLATVALANLTLPGAWLVAAGIGLNALVVTANGGAMPVSRGAAAVVGRVEPFDALHEDLNPGTLLPMLGDVIPIPLIGNVYSVGDAVLALGVFFLTFRTMTART